jgi:hypothetical protein
MWNVFLIATYFNICFLFFEICDLCKRKLLTSVLEMPNASRRANTSFMLDEDELT